MKNFCIACLIFAVYTLSGSPRPTFAQTTAPPPPKTELVRIHNVRPDLMAYWIDPTHQPVPREYQNHFSLSNLSREQINQYIPEINAFEGSFHGQIIAAMNSQNALMISADQYDLDKDKKLIEAMDKPLQQVDVEGLLLLADPKILKTTPTRPLHLLSPRPKDDSYNIALMPGNADTLIKQLLSSGKIKQVNGPRVTAIDNFPAYIGSRTATPIELGISQTPGLHLPIKSIGGQQIGLETDNIMKVIPAINADGTVTMSLTLSFNASLVNYQAFSSEQPDRIFIKSLNGGPITFDYTVKDNQSVLITGIDHLLTMGDYHPPSMILILTARVQHRYNTVPEIDNKSTLAQPK